MKDTKERKPLNIVFESDHFGTIGRLYEEDGTLKFKGNADKSAELFFEHIIVKHYNQYGKPQHTTQKSPH